MINQDSIDMPSKLEDLFLRILRIVTLVALVLTLLLSVVFAFQGLGGMTASPDSYDFESPSTQELINQAKESLKEPSQPGNDGSTTPTEKSDKQSKSDQRLEEEIDRQVKILSDFLTKFESGLTNPERTKARLLNAAKSLAFEPDDDSSVFEYAEGQTEFFDKILNDQEVIAALKKDESRMSSFFNEVLSTYPAYFSEQKKESETFAQEEKERVALSKLGSATNFYIAAGMFCSFLLISLILVLVKIERNLRVRQL
jgi:hypothetical protein